MPDMHSATIDSTVPADCAVDKGLGAFVAGYPAVRVAAERAVDQGQVGAKIVHSATTVAAECAVNQDHVGATIAHSGTNVSTETTIGYRWAAAISVVHPTAPMPG